MAIPERRNLNEEPISAKDLSGERMERASRSGWRWLWVIPVVVAVALWWVGWGWGGTGGWWWGRQHSQNTAIPAPKGSRTTETLANAGAEQPLTSAGADAGGAKLHMTGPGVQMLTQAHKQEFIGDRFQASDVPVQKKVNAHAMWIGEGNPMLAIVTNTDNRTETDAKDASQGKSVNAAGVIKAAPSATQAKQEWKLSDQDASRLEQQGAYIQVSQLTLPQQ